jgi:hypothetical protein
MGKAQNRSPAMIEALEGRQFLSTSVLGPSAVEGHYKGDATYAGGAQDLRLTITAKSETLTVLGYGSETVALSSKAFKKLREGSFSWSGTIDGVHLKLSGSVIDKGTRINASFSATGKITGSGTVALKKY